MYNIFNQRFPSLLCGMPPEKMCDITGIRTALIFQKEYLLLQFSLKKSQFY